MATMNPFTTKIRLKEDLLGIELYAYKWDDVGRKIFKTGTYDPFISSWIIDRFKEKQHGNFIDIGANLGYFTCLLGKLAGPAGRVLAIEPEPDNLALLEANIAANSLSSVITVMPVALGCDDTSATLNLYKNSNRGRHSLVAKGTGQQLVVPVKRLDALIDQVFKTNEVIDILKIDVEGYEPFVIQGASDTLSRVQVMIMEWAPYILRHAEVNLSEFIENLYNKFSKIYIIDKNSLIQTNVQEILGLEKSVDLLFAK
jgi:FkbM family methyltransferase